YRRLAANAAVHHQPYREHDRYGERRGGRHRLDTPVTRRDAVKGTRVPSAALSCVDSVHRPVADLSDPDKMKLHTWNRSRQVDVSSVMGCARIVVDIR